MGRMDHFRGYLEAGLAQLYSKTPERMDELRRLAAQVFQDPQAVKDLLTHIEERVRGKGGRRKPGARPAIRPGSKSLMFHGVDLSGLPVHTAGADLPDLYVERPKGSKSWEMRKDLRVLYQGPDGTVYYVPKKKHYYVQHDVLGLRTCMKTSTVVTSTA